MRTALESRMTENADTIIDTEPTIMSAGDVLGLREAVVEGRRMPQTQVHRFPGIYC